MHQLSVLANSSLVQTFVDYMAMRGITILVYPQGDELELFCENVGDLEIARQELGQFLHDPLNQRYNNAAWQAGRSNVVRHFPQSESYLKIIYEKAGPLTLGVIVLCLIMYGLMQVIGDRTALMWFGFPDSHAAMLQLWRWITPAFLHFNIMHIAFNLVMWWYVGGLIERRLGTPRLAKITLLSILLSNTGQYIISGNYYFGGLSGAVYALFGYAWLSGQRMPARGVYLDNALMGFALLWLVFGYFDIFISVANTAHLVGLMSGLVLAWWDTRQRNAQ